MKMNNLEQIKIFIVDDDSFFQNLVMFELQKTGYQNILTFNNGTDFLDNLYQKPDLVILDYNMPDYNGLQILKEVMSIDPDINVILVSAQNQIEVAIDTMRFGAVDYVVKNSAGINLLCDKIQDIISFKKVNTANTSILQKMTNTARVFMSILP